ncbi:MAG: hypothetical protein ACJ8AI_28240 [Rhodopila sp.]
MDASHFRRRAAIARELALTGEDVRLAQMLMELAADLDAEADTMEAEQAGAVTARRQQDDMAIPGALPEVMPGPADKRPAQIIDLTLTGIKSPEIRSGKGSGVVLPFPGSGLRREPIGQSAAECDAVPA